MEHSLNNSERINLIHALMAASNAFHNTLKQYGYNVGYGLDNTKTGSIIKIDAPIHENWSLGDLTIVWKLRK